MKKDSAEHSCLAADNKINPLYRKKHFGILLLIIGVFGILVVLHRLAHYVYEYDAQFSPIDYGRYNIISYFTVQSNIFVCFYLVITAAAVFGNKRAQKIAFNPIFGAMVTTYIVITGLVYCCGIPLGFTPPFKWDNPTHSMSSFIQVFHHMIVPPFMLILWFFPTDNKKISCKKMWLVGIYPLAYSIFSIIRGALSDPAFYPYPFYQPTFFWEMLFGNQPLKPALAYLLMLPALIAGIMLFVAVGIIIAFIHNKRRYTCNN